MKNIQRSDAQKKKLQEKIVAVEKKYNYFHLLRLKNKKQERVGDISNE